MNKRQKQIVKAMDQLPEKMTPDEFEAMICSLVSAYTGFEETPAFLLYLHLKTVTIQKRLNEQAKKETKH